MDTSQSGTIDDLRTLNKIVETLNRSTNLKDVLDTTLSDLIDLMGLETGWIFMKDNAALDGWWGKGYVLKAHHNLPPALDLNNAAVWAKGCDCQDLCNQGRLSESYNEIRCSRLASAQGNRKGLRVHASTPLRSGTTTYGILNVAAPDWDSIQPQKLELLNNVGNQMGVAIERANLFEILKDKRIHEQAALLEMSNQLLARLDKDDLLDYIVAEAVRLLKADACALLLPGDDLDFLCFQAAKGWQNDPVELGRQIPADESSGPGLVMLTRNPIIVEDLQEHDPVPWLPTWIMEEAFRGHAIIPLIVEGRSIGVMVLNTRRPHLLDGEEFQFLRLMVNQAAIAIEKSRLHREEIERNRMEEELEVGRQIQLSILPDTVPKFPGWEFAATNRSALQVGGDFYDFFDLPDKSGKLGIVIADVMDKGVPAALFMALSRTVIRTTALSGRHPSRALIRANELILKDSRASLFLSAIYAELDTESGQLIFANAGHNRPIWLQMHTGACEVLVSDGVILAAFDEIELEEKSITIIPGDILVLYTDGLTDAQNGEGRSFGEARLCEVIRENKESSAHQMLITILKSVHQFSGDTSLSDDLTLIILKRSIE
ncbi:MAG: SpoIIE family protein phosphatase [Anaerolineales bacterium]|jgi:sigma-B regulation protein RsbU (phosphoserine phosphatase)